MKNQSYSSACKLRPFNWNRFLNRKRYNELALDKAVDRSGNWVTCACGNQCNSLPRDWAGVPADNTLRLLGATFCDDICHMSDRFTGGDEAGLNKYRKKALITLSRIEARSNTLLRQMAKANK